MNLILFRYILKQFAVIFLATLSVLIMVVMLFDVIELLRSASKHDGVSFWDVGILAILKSPQMVHIILPFVTLIAGLIFLFKFDKTSELVVMRSVGLSVWNVILPLLLLIAFVGVFDVTIFNPISAMTARKYERMEEHLGLTHSTPFVWSSKGFWLRDIRPDKVLVIRAARVRQENKEVLLDNVSVFELDENNQFLRQNEAQIGILKDGILTLKNPFVIDTMAESGEQKNQAYFDTDLSLERILEKFDEPQTMSFWRFPRFIRFLKESGFTSVTHEMYWHELIAFPATLLAMIFISIVFAVHPSNRQGKVLTRILSAVLCGFFLYFLTRVTNVLGQSHSLPMMLAAWGPALVVIPLCVSALLHMEDG
ncbi:MAG: LptF/LptG family permease [Pseudomonadota bacterium]|nr:LptF/LptG family permease [Pseudomonadota bacterium]